MAQLPRRKIFRESAYKHYLQKREQDVLPQVVSPPVFLCAWILLGLLLAGGTIAWLAQVPTYAAAPGVIQPGDKPNETRAIIFFQRDLHQVLQKGQSIQISLGPNQPEIQQATIADIKPGMMSPADARKQFSLDQGIAPLVERPSTVVTVDLGQQLPVKTFVGSTVTAQAQVGAQQIIFLLFKGSGK